MRQNLPLPFPVRNAADLERAIKYVSRASKIDNSSQRYVIARARQLGRTDLLPSSWTNMTTTHQETTLDQQLEHLAEKHDIGIAQLKTVYLRGVDAFVASDITYGSATMYGLARVQRFINERGAVVDSDLTPQEELLEVDCGIELTAGQFFLPDIIYASGEKIATLFAPGIVTALAVTDDALLVAGELGQLNWEYQLDTRTGATYFDVQ